MHENRVYYNIMEANLVIPRLECLFAELARIQRQVNELAVKAMKLGIDVRSLENAPWETVRSNPVKKQLKERIITFSEEYAKYLDEIEEFGVVVDDLEIGIVNFYSWIDGKEIFLSWQYGEREIKHWHAVTENAVARRPLQKLFSRKIPEASLH